MTISQRGPDRRSGQPLVVPAGHVPAAGKAAGPRAFAEPGPGVGVDRQLQRPQQLALKTTGGLTIDGPR